MWIWLQDTGELLRAGQVVGWGYSGHGEGKNNPAMHNVMNIGPIPAGMYDIQGPPIFTKEHGPYVLRLNPAPSTELFGRSGFLIHGDSLTEPGTASCGCIILPRLVRNQIWESGDTSLCVLPARAISPDVANQSEVTQ